MNSPTPCTCPVLNEIHPQNLMSLCTNMKIAPFFLALGLYGLPPITTMISSGGSESFHFSGQKTGAFPSASHKRETGEPSWRFLAKTHPPSEYVARNTDGRQKSPIAEESSPHTPTITGQLPQDARDRQNDNIFELQESILYLLLVVAWIHVFFRAYFVFRKK